MLREQLRQENGELRQKVEASKHEIRKVAQTCAQRTADTAVQLRVGLKNFLAEPNIFLAPPLFGKAKKFFGCGPRCSSSPPAMTYGILNFSKEKNIRDFRKEKIFFPF